MKSITTENLVMASALWLGFFVVLFVLRIVVPGPVHHGQLLKDGTRKAYKLNAFYILLIVSAVIGVGQVTHLFSLSTVNRLFWPLVVVGNVFAFAVTGWLAVRGRRNNRARGLPVGSVGHDLFFGAELNPDLWGVDLKMFFYIPSLIGLLIVNLSFAAVQWEELGHLTTRMMLYQAFFTIYVFNYFQFEYGMLHTWDVIAENFGWMLVWGDTPFVPFFYSIGGWFVLRNPAPMAGYEVAALCLLFAVGLWTFRGANQQKHDYKENPSAPIWGRKPETVGGKLLVSGFWGIGRKLNYTGELMVYFSWTICTGTESIVPYVLPLWLVCLFAHRAWRDEQRCHAKYGALWDEYCRRARFRMIPFIY
jgi:delta14-sterol reductase